MHSMEVGDDGRICSRCITNKHLKKKIRENGESGLCAECMRQCDFTVTIEDFGILIGSIVQSCLEPVGEIGFSQEGQPLEEHIHQFLGQELAINERVAKAVVAAEKVNEQEGETSLFHDELTYVDRLAPSNQLLSRWEAIEVELKHRRRFFNTNAKAFFDDIFSDIDRIQARAPKNGKPEDVVHNLPSGTKLFRARLCSNSEMQLKMLAEPWQVVGPPPRSQATEGRMNSKGVVMFYGAMEKATDSSRRIRNVSHIPGKVLGTTMRVRIQ